MLSLLLAFYVASAVARDCGPRLEPVPPAGVSLAAAIDLVAMLLPAEFATDFRARAERVKSLPISPTEGRARLSYRSRFFDWRVDRWSSAKVLWNERAPSTPDARADLIAATIDLVTEANFTPVRRPSIYRRTLSTFTDDNAVVLRDKLLYHLFALGPPTQTPIRPSPTARLLRTIFRPLLPAQFAVIRGLALTPEHVDVFMEDGPAGLYRHVRRREGLELSLRYWFTHVTNVQSVLTAAYAATIAPSLYEAWRYVFDLHLVAVDDPTPARTLLRAMRDTPAHVVEHGRKLFEQLPPLEKKALTGLFGK